jgi:hypothetical protein
MLLQLPQGGLQFGLDLRDFRRIVVPRKFGPKLFDMLLKFHDRLLIS